MSGTAQLPQALMDPGSYPHVAAPVEMVETHISLIFFAGDYVYKVKKPVDYGFLDFTSLEKRRYFCQREVELNRRICPEVYLGVEEIREENGRLSVGGSGRTVEYGVKMLRLSFGNSMGQLLKERRVSTQDVRRVAARISRFHRQAEMGPRIIAYGGLGAVRQNVEENFAQTREFVDVALSREVYDDLAAYSLALMEVREQAFQVRADAGRVRDCHGDLQVICDALNVLTPAAQVLQSDEQTKATQIGWAYSTEAKAFEEGSLGNLVLAVDTYDSFLA